MYKTVTEEEHRFLMYVFKAFNVFNGIINPDDMVNYVVDADYIDIDQCSLYDHINNAIVVNPRKTLKVFRATFGEDTTTQCIPMLAIFVVIHELVHRVQHLDMTLYSNNDEYKQNAEAYAIWYSYKFPLQYGEWIEWRYGESPLYYPDGAYKIMKGIEERWNFNFVED